jgi:hypothetical protein
MGCGIADEGCHVGAMICVQRLIDEAKAFTLGGEYSGHSWSALREWKQVVDVDFTRTF